MNKLFSALASLLLLGAAQAQVTFSLNKSLYFANETITATWSGRSSGFAADWVAIYPQGTSPGSVNSTRWRYVSGTATPTVPYVAGSVNFTSPGLAAGSWTAYFLENDGYQILAQANFTVSGGGSARTLSAFSLDKTSYRPGETITASWSGLTQPSGTDWVGIYPKNLSGVPDGSPGSTIWYYLNNTRSGTTGTAAGSVNFINPGLPVGEWRAYFLLNDGYQFLSTVDFTVSLPPILGFGADHRFIDDSPVITLSWALNPSTIVQSLTLGDGSTTVDVLGQETLDVTPVANKTYTLTLNGTSAARARVFKNAAQSDAFSLGSTVVETAGGIDISWTGAAAAPDSWVAIYRAGDTPGPVQALQWNYLNGTKIPGGSHPSGTLDFNPPAGEYYAILFGNAGYDLVEQGPIRFVVADGPFHPLAITGSGFDEGDFRIEWNSKPSIKYDVEVSTDLVNWSYLKNNWRAASTTSSVHAAPQSLTGGEFFRVREK